MDLPQLIRWVHAGLSDEERASRLREAESRQSVADGVWLFSRDSDQIKAGVYFLRLPGDVATLGGIRYLQGQDSIAVDLLTRAIQVAYASGVEQVQGIVAEDDVRSETVLGRQLEPIATFTHIYRHQSLPAPKIALFEHSVSWKQANEYAARRVANMVAATFEGTLDCPELNGIRTPTQVLRGFLDGLPLRTQPYWLLLHVDGQVAGCLLLKKHAASELLELCYVGLLPKFRGRGLGRVMIGEAIRRTELLSCNVLAAAVDTRNLPALKIYHQFGFRSHQHLRAWLHIRDKSQRVTNRSSAR